MDTTNRPRPMERSLATGQGPAEGCRAARRAFSLVELLVVMAVVAIVAMLSLPAIQSAREAARRIACRDNLRHLALGVLEHESATRRLPPAARVTEASNPATCTGCWNPWLEAGLGGAAPGILWNFEKFVVGRNGQVVARFSPDVAADDPRLVSVLEAELAKPA